MCEFIEANNSVNNQLKCKTCGAILYFKPGTLSLVCQHCGTENVITDASEPTNIEENDLESYLARHHDQEETIEVATVNCDSCGAVVTMDPNIVSDKCPFCASNLVVRGGTTSRLHKPQYILPFLIDINKATDNYKQWLTSLWFAPNDLKQYVNRADKLNGMYIPYWTFDCQTNSSYTGQRGEIYYETETYTTEEDGKQVTRTRQVQRIAWYPASGRVGNEFDDLLIEATRSLNLDKLRELEPWDLKKLIPYDDRFLSGFRTETYVIDVKNAYVAAKGRMEPVIAGTIRRDIGGDQQVIISVDTTYHNPTFKHVLLPVWISAYRYNNKVYQFLINARTGEVQGERPYSAIKIALAIIFALIVIGIIFAIVHKK